MIKLHDYKENIMNTENGSTIPSLIDKGKTWIALWLTAVSVLVVPLYARGGYNSLIGTKASVYLHLALPALIPAGILAAASVFLKVRARDKGPHIRLSLPVLSAVALWSLLSSRLSPDAGSSFWGTVGWSVGSLLISTAVCSTICIISFLPQRIIGGLPGSGLTGKAVRVFSAAFFIVTGLIFLFAVIQAAGFDPFGFLSKIDRGFYFSYLSTIGQKNSFSGYLCLILPFIWGLFMESRKLPHILLLGFLSVLGLFCCAIADSDSVYAGLGICMLFMIPFVLDRQQRARRASVLLFFFGFILFGAQEMSVFSARLSNLHGFSASVFSLAGGAAFSLAGVLLFFFSKNHFTSDTESPCKNNAPRILSFLLQALILGSIIVWIVYTAGHFSDSWGTRRGLIWRIGWEEFLKYPFSRKMTGIGPEMTAILYARLRVDPGINVVSAHCEPLHVLLTQGTIGFLLYLLFWGYCIYLFIKNSLWKGCRAVWFFPLAAYLGQSFFCTAYPVTAAVFSTAAGFYFPNAENP